MKKLFLILTVFSVITNSYSSCDFNSVFSSQVVTPSCPGIARITLKSGQSMNLDILAGIDSGLRILQDRQKAAFDSMMSQLRDLHGSIYNLPYDAEYIRTTIIPEVNANRTALAPHYPDRNVYGDNGEQAYQLLRIWFETYPSECQAYMEFLRTYIDTHSN